MGENGKLLEAVRQGNIEALQHLDASLGTLDKDKCIAAPVLTGIRIGQERTYRNQELILGEVVKQNGSASAPEPPEEANPDAGKKISLLKGLFEAEGFSVRDIARLVLIIAFIVVVFHMFGILNELRALRGQVNSIAPKPPAGEVTDGTGN